jgi:hypothetical protein
MKRYIIVGDNFDVTTDDNGEFVLYSDYIAYVERLQRQLEIADAFIRKGINSTTYVWRLDVEKTLAAIDAAGRE